MEETQTQVLRGEARLTTDSVLEMRRFIKQARATMLAQEGAGRYYSMVNTSLERAWNWMGRILETLNDAGSSFPGETLPDLPVLAAPKDFTRADHMNQCRELLRTLVQQVHQWSLFSGLELAPEQNHEILVANLAAITHLEEARMDIGCIIEGETPIGAMPTEMLRKYPQSPKDSYPPEQRELRGV